ncbi:uncharacterized protein LOC127757084 [Oryza glaberrima]|uniref:Uncharacterized protein n=1 Tax=Oryza glaberrima TaxID=4538 RepID=I1R864_ORYGL|nr:uncharacterized protein LOC127757084 [Oryza glaberrima]
MATMAPRLLIVVVSVLFTAGIIASAVAARDLTADPAGQAPPAYDFGIPAGFFVPGTNNPYNGDPAAWAAGYGSAAAAAAGSGAGAGDVGGFGNGGAEAPSMVCSDKGPCNGKKLTCPKKCFVSFSRSGNGYAAGGGGGGCSFDCSTKCEATC